MRDESATDCPQLVPGHGFCLIAEGTVDRERFIRLFHETWQALPRAAAERILQHWYRVAMDPPHQGAVVHLARDFPWTRDPRAKHPAAATHPPGARMDFLERYLESLSPRSAKALIAHELAHVYLHADRGDAATPAPDDTRAYDLETEWGFDVRGLLAEKAWLRTPYVPKLFWKLYAKVASVLESRTRRRR